MRSTLRRRRPVSALSSVSEIRISSGPRTLRRTARSLMLEAPLEVTSPTPADNEKVKIQEKILFSGITDMRMKREEIKGVLPDAHTQTHTAWDRVKLRPWFAAQTHSHLNLSSLKAKNTELKRSSKTPPLPCSNITCLPNMLPW